MAMTNCSSATHLENEGCIYASVGAVKPWVGTEFNLIENIAGVFSGAEAALKPGPNIGLGSTTSFLLFLTSRTLIVVPDLAIAEITATHTQRCGRRILGYLTSIIGCRNSHVYLPTVIVSVEASKIERPAGCALDGIPHEIPLVRKLGTLRIVAISYIDLKPMRISSLPVKLPRKISDKFDGRCLGTCVTAAVVIVLITVIARLDTRPNDAVAATRILAALASVIRVIITIIADFSGGWVEDSVTASGNGAVRIAVNCLATVITGFDTDFYDRVTTARDGAGVGAAVAIISVTIIAEFPRARDAITAAGDCAFIGALVGIYTIAVIALFTVSRDVIPTGCWGAIAVTAVSIILVIVIAALCKALQTVPACINYAQALVTDLGIGAHDPAATAIVAVSHQVDAGI